MLPLIYLMRYLMMMVGAVEALALLVNVVRDRPSRDAGRRLGVA